MLDEDFEDPLTDWTFSEMNDGYVGWQVSDDIPYADDTALFYGNTLHSDYDNGEQNSGYVITPEILLQPGVANTMMFDVFMEIETALAYDLFQVQVDWTGEDVWIPVWDKSELLSMLTWNTYAVDLAGLAGETIRVRFWFDTVDSVANDLLGIFLDNLVLSSTCLPKPCVEDADCADDVPGTIGTCAGDLCVYEISEEPCQDAGDCEDDDLCTIDTCEGVICEYTIADDCCYKAEDCDDGNVCTADSCDLEGLPVPLCVHDWTEGCCLQDADCDDLNPCTDDLCPGEGEQCTNPWIEGCCLSATDCDDDDPCTVDDCSDGVCVNQYCCCDGDGDCDDGDDVCTDDACVDGFCQFLPSGAAGCCDPLVYEEGFDGGLADWFIEGGDEVFSWHESGVKYQSGLSALHFGDAAGESYGDGQDATATSPKIELPDQPGLSLGFWIWFHTESGFDDLTVSLVLDNDSVLPLDEFTGDSGQEWTEQSYDLYSLAGQTIRVRFTWHSDSSVSSFPGAWIDSLTVSMACCNEDADCDDGNPCTTDICPGAESLCINLPEDSCCISDGDCDDGDPCTMDDCPQPGAACTNIVICCSEDVDCDDGDDACTDDVCVDGLCQFLPTGAAGCCDPEFFADDFEDGLDQWTLWEGGAADEYTWQISGVQTWTGDGALNYGNAAGDSYGNDQDAYALSPEIDLSNQPSVNLSFQLWYDTEPDFDHCDVTLVGPDGETTLDAFTGFDGQEWTKHVYDLSPWSGQTVRVKILWYSDGSVSSYPGCFFDDLVVGQDCCVEDADCEDGNECTEDICPGEYSLCINQWLAGCCLVEADCDDGDECTVDICDGMTCSYVWSCCEADGDCDDGDDICTDDVCVDGFCQFIPTGAVDCCVDALFIDDFSALTGWQLDQNWEIGGTSPGADPGYGNLNPEFDHSSDVDNSVLGVYVGGFEPADTACGPFFAESPVMDISLAAEPHLSFWRWLNSDYEPFMVNYIDAWDGMEWQQLWVTADVVEDDAWFYMDFDVTAHKNSWFRVRIGYEVGSAGAYAYTSWNVDDVQVYDAAVISGGGALCCDYDSDCEGIYPDGAVCSAGQCI